MVIKPRKSIESFTLSETGPAIEVHDKRAKTVSVFRPKKGDPDKTIPLRGDIEIVILNDGEIKISREQWINLGFDVVEKANPIIKSGEKEQ